MPLVKPMAQFDWEKQNNLFQKKEGNVAKTARCKDTGLNCDFIFRGDTEEELLADTVQHGTDAHRIGARGDESARMSGQDFVSAPGLAAGMGAGERDNWVQKVKDAIREE